MKPYFQDKDVTIYHGDCREILPQLPNKVDLVLTDPPYGVVNRESQGLRLLDKGNADLKTVQDKDVAWLCASPVNQVYIWCGTEQVSDYRRELIRLEFSTRICIWEKTNPSPLNGDKLWLSSFELCVYGKKNGATFNAFCESPIFRFPVEDNTEHPTQKSLRLFQKLILASSNVGDTILDPFMGSGTTLRAAKNLGRKAIGIEIEEKYCEIAAKRMAQTVMDFEALK